MRHFSFLIRLNEMTNGLTKGFNVLLLGGCSVISGDYFHPILDHCSNSGKSTFLRMISVVKKYETN